MSKMQISPQSIYLSVIGLLAGFIIGFFYANHYNREAILAGASGTAAPPGMAAANTGQLPPDHPPIADEEDLGAAMKLADDDPKNFDAQMAAVQSLYRAGRLDDAMRIMQRAIKLKPDDPQAIAQMGNLNYDLGDNKSQQGDKESANPYFLEAAKWYEQALKKNPNDVNIRTDLGLTYYFRQPPDLNKAIAAYRQSLAIDPNHPQTLYNMTIALTDKGELDEAQTLLAKLNGIAPGAPILDRLKKGIEEKRAGVASSGPAPKPLAVK
ncbi:MAG: tetratricopeptide repeat protein [Acidobacteria bacterium]|nr:tetratricopeptide repeat protein [Acidobacteriota bacterium]